MIVNGKETKLLEETNIESFIESLGLDKNKIVFELNLSIVPKEKYRETLLREEDSIEIVSFIGGG